MMIPLSWSFLTLWIPFIYSCTLSTSLSENVIKFYIFLILHKNSCTFNNFISIIPCILARRPASCKEQLVYMHFTTIFIKLLWIGYELLLGGAWFRSTDIAFFFTFGSFIFYNFSFSFSLSTFNSFLSFSFLK